MFRVPYPRKIGKYNDKGQWVVPTKDELNLRRKSDGSIEITDKLPLQRGTIFINDDIARSVKLWVGETVEFIEDKKEAVDAHMTVRRETRDERRAKKRQEEKREEKKRKDRECRTASRKQRERAPARVY